MKAAAIIGDHAYTYAQEKSGAKLHLVEFWATGRIATFALCGFWAQRGWRMTINLPLNHSCRNCQRIFALRNRKVAS